YACVFKQVFVPDARVISKDADAFVEKVRPVFMAYQIPLGLGVTAASIHSIEKVGQKQNGCNQFLQTQPTTLKKTNEDYEKKLITLLEAEQWDWKAIAKIRLDSAYL